MADVDAFATKVANCLGSAAVVADTADERHARAHPPAGHGLVGSFAAECLKEILAVHRFAWLGKFRSFEDEIGVRAADHDHVVIFHVLSRGKRSRENGLAEQLWKE